MRTDRRLFRIFAVVMLCGLAACQPRATITTNREASYQKDVKRLMVIETIGDALGRQIDSFHAVLTQRLQACGATVTFIARPPHDPLALDNSAALAEQRKENEMLHDFAPDAVLFMSQVSAMSSGGSVRNITYAMQLADLPTRRIVWKANLDLFTNYDIVAFGDAGAALANDLMTKLSQDAIIRSCPAAKT
jgi:hypothetical protein